ncbi:MAG: hypothetical protein ACMUIA_08170 [bacterium]
MKEIAGEKLEDSLTTNTLKIFFRVLLLLGILILCTIHQEALAGSPSGSQFSSFWVGYYLPRDSLFQKVYPDDKEVSFFAEYSRVWADRIEASLGLGGTYFKGSALNADNTPNIDTVRLTIIPTYIQLSYFLRFGPDQKLVPYAGAGLDAWGYQEKKEEDTTRGFKYGYHYLAGLRFLLDWLDPQAATRLSRDEGFVNTYLVIEARSAHINNFRNSKLDLSGIIYRVGISLEF